MREILCANITTLIPPIRIKRGARGRELRITKTKGTKGIQSTNLIPILGALLQPKAKVIIPILGR